MIGSNVVNTDTILHTAGPGLLFTRSLVTDDYLEVAPGAKLAIHSGTLDGTINLQAGQTFELSGVTDWSLTDPIAANIILNDTLVSITGDGGIFITDELTWRNGDVSVRMEVRLGAKMTIASPAERRLTAELLNQGELVQEDGNVRVGFDEFITNLGLHRFRGGSLTLPDSSTTYVNQGLYLLEDGGNPFGGTAGIPPGLFLNQGTVRNAIGRDTATFFLAFENTFFGTVEIQDSSRMTFFKMGFLQDGTLTIGAQASIRTDRATINQPFSLPASSNWDILGFDTVTVNTELNLDGDLRLRGNITGTERLIVNGAFLWSMGDLSTWTVIGPTGTLLINSFNNSVTDAFLQLQGTTEHRGGMMTINGFGGVFNNIGASYRMTGGTISGEPGTRLFDNEGYLELASGGDAFTGGGSLSNSFGGEIKTSAPTAVEVNASLSSIGVLSGAGALNVNGLFSNGGLISPGDSPGELTFNQLPLSNDSRGILIEIASDGGPGAGHDRVVVSDTPLVLDGQVEVRLLDGYVPAPGDTFSIASAPLGVTGQFSDVALPTEVDWEVVYDSTEVLLVVSGALPLELTSFFGETAKSGNILTWKTATEVNTATHELLRSSDARWGWEQIATTPAAGVSQFPLAYTITDPAPPTSAYYRVRTVDLDGSEHLSPIIHLERTAGAGIRLAPNPAVDYFTVDVPGRTAATGHLRLYSSQGALIREQPLVGGNQRIPTAGLADGLYLVEVTLGRETYVERLVRSGR